MNTVNAPGFPLSAFVRSAQISTAQDVRIPPESSPSPLPIARTKLALWNWTCCRAENCSRSITFPVLRGRTRSDRSDSVDDRGCSEFLVGSVPFDRRARAEFVMESVPTRHLRFHLSRQISTPKVARSERRSGMMGQWLKWLLKVVWLIAQLISRRHFVSQFSKRRLQSRCCGTDSRTAESHVLKWGVSEREQLKQGNHFRRSQLGCVFLPEREPSISARDHSDIHHFLKVILEPH